MFFNFQILIVFDTKEKTYLIGSLIREPGLKRFVLHAVKKYWKGRRHRWWTAFVLQFYIKKFRNSSGKLLFVIWEKSRPVRGGGGGIIYFHHLSSLDYHEFLQRVFICVSSGFSLPSVFFPHEGILDAVDFLDHHITHRRYEQLFHLFEFPWRWV